MMTRTEMNMLTERFGNPVEPLIFKADALEAVRIASKEMEDKAIEAYKSLCPCYQNGKQALSPQPKTRYTNM